MSGFVGFLKDFGPSIAWIVAAVGWGINNYHANEREKRKEFRSEIDAIEKSVKTILEKSAKYYNLPTRDEAAQLLELDLKLLFHEIDYKWVRLSKRKFHSASMECKKDCVDALGKFYDETTGEHFESNARLEASAVGPYLQRLSIAGLIFVEALHKLFLRQFDRLP